MMDDDENGIPHTSVHSRVALATILGIATKPIGEMSPLANRLLDAERRPASSFFRKDYPRRYKSRSQRKQSKAARGSNCNGAETSSSDDKMRAPTSSSMGHSANSIISSGSVAPTKASPTTDPVHGGNQRMGVSRLSVATEASQQPLSGPGSSRMGSVDLVQRHGSSVGVDAMDLSEVEPDSSLHGVAGVDADEIDNRAIQ